MPTNRGKPLAWPLRDAIKARLRDGWTIAAVARELRLSRMTVYKYATSLDTFRSKESAEPI